MSEQEKYLIWSEEHQGWWSNHGCGYTRMREKADRYSFAEAFAIVQKANRYNATIQERMEPVEPKNNCSADKSN